MARTEQKKSVSLPAVERPGREFRTVARACLFALTVAAASCASYDDSSALHSYGPVEDGVMDAGSGAGAPAVATAGNGPTAGATSAAGGSGGDVGDAGTAVAGTSASAGGAAGASSSGGSAGASTGGSSGGSGAGGGGGSAGAAAGGQSSGGSGGGAVTDQLLSLNKPATADSEETTKGNLAALGNDGSATTRWCAADGAAGHYWQVDLGASYTLGKLEITWEKAANYQFKVEGSADGNAWTSVLDETATTNATADQTYPLSAAPKARYVRVTTTTLPSATIWASFFEFSVYGH
jgi:F5/8 type C domain